MSDIEPGFKQIGDHRDIPLALGLVAIGWNRCESRLREIVESLACRGHWENRGAVEIIVTELGTVGITQALQCYSRGFPDGNDDIGEAIRCAVEWAERLKTYRNYYVHAIYSVTPYGMILTEEMITKETLFHEAITMGPYGMVYQKSAKGKSKWAHDFITADSIIWLNRQLVDLNNYLDGVAASINHYFRANEWRKCAPLPPRPDLPEALQKSDLLPLLRHLPPPLRRDEDLIARVERDLQEGDVRQKERERKRPSVDPSQ